MAFNQKKYPRIQLTGCQIKSYEKALLLSQCLDTLEKEFGIGSVEIRFKDCFVCPDIDLMSLYNSDIPMNHLIGKILIQLDKQLYGKKSRYKKVNTERH